MTNQPIAIFDSGIGGLTVLRRLQQRFPQESFVYLGDTARLPYGTKSPETVTAYALQMTQILLRHHPKAIVIACNTASAAAYDAVKAAAGGIPVIGMIEPAAGAALSLTRNNHIAVMGTNGTIRSGAYERMLLSGGANRISVMNLPCQLLVALAEEGWTAHPATMDILQTYLAPVLMNRAAPDTIILGCTHFPVFLPLLEKMLPHTAFIHCGDAAADALAPVLVPATHGNPPSLEFMVTDGIENFTRSAAQFFGAQLAPNNIHLIDAGTGAKAA